MTPETGMCGVDNVRCIDGDTQEQLQGTNNRVIGVRRTTNLMGPPIAASPCWLLANCIELMKAQSRHRWRRRSNALHRNYENREYTFVTTRNTEMQAIKHGLETKIPGQRSIAA